MSFLSASSIFILTIVLLIPFFLNRKQFITPLKIYSFFTILTTIPYLLNLSFDTSIMHYSVHQYLGVHGIQSATFYYIFIQVIGSLSLFLGYFAISSPQQRQIISIDQVNEKYAEKTLLFFSLIAFMIAILSFYFKLQSVGGLLHLLGNIGLRSTLSAGTGYISFLFTMMIYLSIFLYMYSFKYKQSKKKVFFFVFLFVTAFAMFTIFGGRKPFIHLVIISLLLWNYAIKKIERVSAKHVFFALSLLFYFVSVLMLREDGAIEAYSKEPTLFLTDFILNLGGFLNNLSFVDTYIFITDYFKYENFWFGSIYFDLAQAPIPSSIFPDKPPVDEGVYIRSLLYGINAVPPMPFYKLYPSSFPPETLGNGYANFGIMGVVVWMFILGMIYKIFYNKVKRRPSLFNIFMLAFVLMNFHLSNLRIVQFLMSYAIAWLFLKLVFSSNGRIRKFVIEK